MGSVFKQKGLEMVNDWKKSIGLLNILGGILWLGLYFHQQKSHGTTQLNEMNVVWGSTWMDSGKLYVIPFLFVFGGLIALYQQRQNPGKLGQISSKLVYGAMSFLILMTIFEFWSFKWGSYNIRYEDATSFIGSNNSGAAQTITSLLLTVFLIPFGIDLVKGKVIPPWFAVLLVLGGLTTVFLSPSLWFPAPIWMILGFLLWQKKNNTN